MGMHSIVYIWIKLLVMLIIGIAGGTGCGKTTVVNQVVKQLPENKVIVISQDSYYNDLSHLTKEQRSKINFDHPNSIDFNLLIEQLRQLKSGKTIKIPRYSFVEETRLKGTMKITPKEVVIVEGILVLSNKRLRELFDIKIYVHADSDERLIRRLQRDIKERGHNLQKVLNRYQTAVKPMHIEFIEPSKEFADIIIPNNHYNTVAVDMLRTIINKKLG